MESLEFIGIIFTAGVVLSWYVTNAAQKSGGEQGLLALIDDEEEKALCATRKTYRMKTRAAVHHREVADTQSRLARAKAKPAFRTNSEAEQLRRKYRRQDEARYRVKDKAAKYTARRLKDVS